jgi:hypothetical protein
MVASESGKTPDKLLLFSFLAARREKERKVNCCFTSIRQRDQEQGNEILQIVEVLEIANCTRDAPGKMVV